VTKIFSKPKAVKAPAPPPPEAIPQEAEQAGDSEVKKVRSQFGYEKQFLAGSLAPKSTGKKTKLGG
jgi:hypothetical protein